MESFWGAEFVSINQYLFDDAGKLEFPPPPPETKKSLLSNYFSKLYAWELLVSLVCP